MARRGSRGAEIRASCVAKIDNAVAAIHAREARDSKVHALRKELKHARANLRLLRRCLSKREFRASNLALRDAARPFAAVRDSKAVIKAQAGLRSAGESGAERTFGACLSRALKREWRTCRDRMQRRTADSSALTEARLRITGISPAHLDRVDIAAAVVRSFKDGRRAGARVGKRTRDDDLHEWRKRVKYLHNQIEDVSRLTDGGFTSIRRQSLRLADHLGDDHDLAVLRDRIRQVAIAEGLALDSAVVVAWMKRVRRKRKSLQSKARSLSKQLFARRAKRLRAKVDRGLEAKRPGSRRTGVPI